MAAGYVYVLLNTDDTTILKIGKTHRVSEKRQEEINRKPHIAGSYIVAYEVFVSDCDTLEKHIHTKLEKFREANEYFSVPLKKAINDLHSVIGEMKKQKLLSFLDEKKEIDPDSWWRNTEIAWQHIFKSNIVINYPNVINTEVVLGIYQALQNSRDIPLRDKICDFIKNKQNLNHNSQNAFNWYKKLPDRLKHEFNRHLPIELSEQQILEIMSLKEIKCDGNQDIKTLSALWQLSNLEYLDISDTQITNLADLSVLKNLRKIDLSRTAITDLNDLTNLPNLEHLICHALDMMVVESFKKQKPNCKVESMPIDSPTLL